MGNNFPKFAITSRLSGLRPLVGFLCVMQMIVEVFDAKAGGENKCLLELFLEVGA